MATEIPENRAPFTVAEIARATGGRILRDGPRSLGVSTDSRTVPRGAAFVALSGERFDGHAYVGAALLRGASTLVVSREVPGAEQVATVLVNDTRNALGGLGLMHRARWGAQASGRTVVGVTGSAGKTTTKNVLTALFEAASPGTVHGTRGNLNNDVGVPMTLLGLEPRQAVAVVEMGTSAPGEIARLAEIARPEIGVLTLVASAHTERIGSLDDVATEKGALLAALPAHGLAVANADDARVMAQLGRSGAAQRKTYGFSAGADYRIVSRTSRGAAGSYMTLARCGGSPLALEIPLLGDAGALAVAAALAVVDWVRGESTDETTVGGALAALAHVRDARLRIVDLADGTWLLDDSYNANPASMRSSIGAAAELASHGARSLVLVLGEMRELGAISAAEHRALAKTVVGSGARMVIVVGDEARPLAEELVGGAMAVSFVSSSRDAAEIACDTVRARDVVLIKGSRGVQTERVVAALGDARGVSGGAGA